MTIKEYFELLPNVNEDNVKITLIENVYGIVFSEEVRQILSNCSDTVFVERYRILSFNEIVDAQDELQFDFKSRYVIPIFDCEDNDFIVYHLDTDKWAKINIVDGCEFKKDSELKDLLK